MTGRPRVGSATGALARSLLVGLSLLWLLGVVGSGVVLKRLIDRHSDDELHESATILLSLVAYTDDLLITAAVLGERAPLAGARHEHERYVFQVRDASGRVLLHGHGSDPALLDAPLQEGFATVDDWRVVTLVDPARRRFIQLADPLAERRDALVSALVWLMLPLAALLAFAAYIVYRASRTLARHVQATAGAVARQDPKALGALPLDGVVTEMRPAVEAANALLARLAAALEAERSFTYNSAHELRTPIAGAMAQAQLLASGTAGTPHQAQTVALVAALSRLARLAERLLALARAEGGQVALAAEPVYLPTVVRLTVDEFAHDARLAGRSLVAESAPARIRGDLDAAGLALRNLVENALVHGVPGTLIRVGCGTSGGRAWLAVTDDGPGSDRDVASLTRRFVRGGHGEGAGLGLSIVETLARRMGARLKLASPPDGMTHGFEASLRWSAADTDAQVPRAQSARRPA